KIHKKIFAMTQSSMSSACAHCKTSPEHARAASDHAEFQTVLGSGASRRLEKSAGLFVDLAHRNQTNVSCDAQIRRSMASAASSSRHLRSPLAMGEQRTAGSW